MAVNWDLINKAKEIEKRLQLEQPLIEAQKQKLAKEQELRSQIEKSQEASLRAQKTQRNPFLRLGAFIQKEVPKIAKGTWEYVKEGVKHPLQTTAGIIEEGGLKPIAGFTKLTGDITGNKTIKDIAGQEEWWLKQYEKNLPNKKALGLGHFLGWMTPYSATEKAVGETSLVGKIAAKSPKLAEGLADALSWISTDQLLYNKETDGSRLKQAMEDLAAFGVLKTVGLGFKAVKNRLAVRAADEIVKPIEEEVKLGKKIPVEDLEDTAQKIKVLFKETTGKEPKELVKDEVLPKVEEVKPVEETKPVGKIKPKETKTEPTETKIPKELEPLAKEAKKYKSVEEFTKQAGRNLEKSFIREKPSHPLFEKAFSKLSGEEQQELLKRMPSRRVYDRWLRKAAIEDMAVNPEAKLIKREMPTTKLLEKGKEIPVINISRNNIPLSETEFKYYRAIKSELEDFYNQAIKEAKLETKLPEPPAGQAKSIELKAEIVPGIRQFIDDDIKPLIGKTTDFLKTAKETFQNLFIPESKSKSAKKVDALLAEQLAKETHTKEVLWKIAEKRRNWWNKVDEQTRIDFMDLVQRGRATKKNLLKLAGGDEEMAKTLLGIVKDYRAKLDDIYKREIEKGIRLNYLENYFPQIWKDPKKAKAFFQKYAESLGKDRFAKQRIIPLIKKGLEAGLELKTTNPEEIVLMRQFEGVRALLRQEFIDKLEAEGLAERYTKGSIVGDRVLIDAPNGHRYMVDSDAAQVVKNAILTKDLWSDKSLGGATFRGLMRLKNTIVPIKLALSLFHPVHLLGIEASHYDANVFKRILDRNITWDEAIKELAKANSYLPKNIEAIKDGLPIVLSFGKNDKELTSYQKELIGWIQEAGGSIKMPDVWRIKATKAFKEAVEKGNFIGASVRGVPALVEAYQKPMFEYWIPAMKVSAFAKEAETLFKAKPYLLEAEHVTERKVELRKIWKSMDNRFGEMFYKTLFWKPILKNLGIGSSLSMGWTLGFIREFGGAGQDTAKLLKVIAEKAIKSIGGKPTKKAIKDYITTRMLFTLDYTIRGMIIGGLLTYALSGEKPKELIDYVFPKVDKRGTRLNTPWYTREFFALENHWRKQGYINGTIQHFANKMNPAIKPLIDAWRNKDYFGYEIRDPNDPKLKQIEDVANHLIEGWFNPISITSIKRASKKGMSKKEATISSLLGFTLAPRYIEETPIQSKIFALYDKRFGGGTKTQKDKEKYQVKSEIRALYLQGKTKEANEKLKEAVKKGYISKRGVKAFVKASDLPSDIKAFKALPSQDQKALISKMKLEDVKRYIWYVHKDIKGKLPKTKATIEFMKLHKSGKIKKPIWKKQKQINK